jgi:Domain of unknown function (DUF3291)
MRASDGWQLVQVNVARARFPVDSAQMADFMALLDPINALADGTEGFVWRLQTEAGDATALRPFDDDRIMINMSVWESFAALRSFVYLSRHLEVMRRRREWFERMAEAYLALWWIPAGQLPTIADARARLDILRERGPSPAAFTFHDRYPAPEPSADPNQGRFEYGRVDRRDSTPSARGARTGG